MMDFDELGYQLRFRSLSRRGAATPSRATRTARSTSTA